MILTFIVLSLFEQYEHHPSSSASVVGYNNIMLRYETLKSVESRKVYLGLICTIHPLVLNIFIVINGKYNSDMGLQRR